MMKRYFCEETVDGQTVNSGQIIIGTDRDIRSLYKQLRQQGYTPRYTEMPKLNADSIYGIDLMADGFYTVMNSDTIARLLLLGVISGEGVRI